MKTMNKARLGIVSFLFTTALIAQASAAAACRVDDRFGTADPSTATYNPGLNQNLGDWGTIFMAADTDTGAPA